jgi:hypothetical protein
MYLTFRTSNDLFFFDILHTPCGGAIMPLSTIFQVFQVVHITFHVVRISGVPCCTTKNITSVLKLRQKWTHANALKLKLKVTQKYLIKCT